MSEITKLYENAGIKPTHYDACALEDKYWNNEELANQYGTLDMYLSFECPHYGEGCYSTCEYAYDKDEYPPFTAEKQLELLKICLDKYEKLEKVRGLKERCIIYYRFDKNGYTEFVNCETWEETIAGLINNLWQSLTEEEKQQVKGILE